MFVTQRQLERALGYAEERYERLNKFYWDLWYRHERLLKHLGLHEERVPEVIELRTKKPSDSDAELGPHSRNQR